MSKPPHGTAAFQPIEAQKWTPRAQGSPGSLVWLTAGEVAERSGVVSCQPSGPCIRGKTEQEGLIAREALGLPAEEGLHLRTCLLEQTP